MNWRTIAGVGAAVILLLWWQQRSAAEASARLEAATKALEQVQRENAEWRKQSDQQIAEYRADNERLTRSLASLGASLRDSENRTRQLQSELSLRLRSVESATQPELVARWSGLVDYPLPKFNPAGQICLDDAAARRTVGALERGASAQAQLTEANAQVGNLKQQVKEQGEVIANKDGELGIERERNTRQVAESDAQRRKSQAEIADVKAKARKSKLKWFLGGIIGGIVIGVMAH